MPPGARWRQVWLHKKHLRRLEGLALELGVPYGVCLAKMVEAARVTGGALEVEVGRQADQVNITVSISTRDWLKETAANEGVSIVALLESWREAGGGAWGQRPGGAALEDDDGDE